MAAKMIVGLCVGLAVCLAGGFIAARRVLESDLEFRRSLAVVSLLVLSSALAGVVFPIIDLYLHELGDEIDERGGSFSVGLRMLVSKALLWSSLSYIAYLVLSTLASVRASDRRQVVRLLGALLALWPLAALMHFTWAAASGWIISV